MKYYLIKFWTPVVIDLEEVTLLIRAVDYKSALDKLFRKFPNAEDPENLTL